MVDLSQFGTSTVYKADRARLSTAALARCEREAKKLLQEVEDGHWDPESWESGEAFEHGYLESGYEAANAVFPNANWDNQAAHDRWWGAREEVEARFIQKLREAGYPEKAVRVRTE